MTIQTYRTVSMDSLGEVTPVTTQGSIAAASDGSRNVIQSIKTGADTNTWDTTGLYLNQPVTIVPDMEILWDYKTAAATNKRFMMLLRNSAGIPFTSQTSIYHVDDNFRVWNGNTIAPEVEVLFSITSTWYNCKAVVRNDGTLEYFIKVDGTTDWIFLARTEISRSFNYLGQSIWFATNQNTNNATHSIDNLVFQVDDHVLNTKTNAFSLREKY